MFTCCICRFETELDDVVAAVATGQCVCLGCYGRVTGNALPVPRALRRAVCAVLTAPEAV